MFRPSQYSKGAHRFQPYTQEMAHLRADQIAEDATRLTDLLTQPTAPPIPPWASDMLARGFENVSQVSRYMTHRAKFKVHPDTMPGAGSYGDLGEGDSRAGMIAAAYPKAASIADLIVATSDKLGIDPAWLANVINFESGFNPAAKNPYSSASGLIQFMEETANGLGTTTPAIRAMSARQQMPLVERYFWPYRGRMKSQEDVYMVVFYPKAVGKPDYVFSAAVQKANPGIRTPRDYVQKANSRAKLASTIGWQAARVAEGAEKAAVIASEKVAGKVADTTAYDKRINQIRWGIALTGLIGIAGITTWAVRGTKRKPA